MSPDTYYRGAGPDTYYRGLSAMHGQGVPPAALLLVLAVLLAAAVLCGRAVQHRAAARQH